MDFEVNRTRDFVQFFKNFYIFACYIEQLYLEEACIDQLIECEDSFPREGSKITKLKSNYNYLIEKLKQNETALDLFINDKYKPDVINKEKMNKYKEKTAEKINKLNEEIKNNTALDKCIEHKVLLIEITDVFKASYNKLQKNYDFFSL